MYLELRGGITSSPLVLLGHFLHVRVNRLEPTEPRTLFHNWYNLDLLLPQVSLIPGDTGHGGLGLRELFLHLFQDLSVGQLGSSDEILDELPNTLNFVLHLYSPVELSLRDIPKD